MAIVVISDVVSGCNTNQEGDIIYNLISRPIIDGQVVTISFQGQNSVTSSFLNSAFVPLLDKVSFDQIKKRLRIVDSNKFINEMVIRRFKQETESCTV
jgi:hypothetical protein